MTRFFKFRMIFLRWSINLARRFYIGWHFKLCSMETIFIRHDDRHCSSLLEYLLSPRVDLDNNRSNSTKMLEIQLRLLFEIWTSQIIFFSNSKPIKIKLQSLGRVFWEDFFRLIYHLQTLITLCFPVIVEKNIHITMKFGI